MPAPATHIILAKIVKDKYFPKIDEKEFFIGTSFADIRYIANIDRNLTHFSDINNHTDITETDAFTIGLKIHSFIDKKWVKYMKENKLYDQLPEGYLISQIIKVFQDKLLYQEILDWQQYLEYFNELISEEKSFNIPDELLSEWHRIIKFCISQKPTEDSAVQFLNSKLQKLDQEKEIRKTWKLLDNNEQVKKILEDFYHEFKLTI